MDPYKALRNQARAKYDAELKKARKERDEIIRWVDQLEATLTPEVAAKPAKGRTFQHVRVAELMPRHSEFSTAELLAIVKAAEPRWRVNKNSIRSCLQYLETNGTARRTRRVAKTVFWAHADYRPVVLPVGVRPMSELAEEVLRERGPLMMVPLLSAIRETGYRAGDDPRRMLSTLHACLNGNKKFRREGKVWELA